MFQSQQYNKDYLYPEEWTDDDKFRFDYLVMESKDSTQDVMNGLLKW